MPMTAVSVVWMLSPDVLYSPYLNIICHWNIPPLLDQKGRVAMFLAGVPLQLGDFWLLLDLDRADDASRIEAASRRAPFLQSRTD